MSPSTAESCKLLEYDAHYLKELTEEKEALAKNGKDNSHALRLLESGKFLLLAFHWVELKQLRNNENIC